MKAARVMRVRNSLLSFALLHGQRLEACVVCTNNNLNVAGTYWCLT